VRAPPREKEKKKDKGLVFLRDPVENGRARQERPPRTPGPGVHHVPVTTSPPATAHTVLILIRVIASLAAPGPGRAVSVCVRWRLAGYKGGPAPTASSSLFHFSESPGRQVGEEGR